MSRKMYSLQFQDQACQLVTQEHYSIAEAAKKLGVHAWTLKNWMKKRGLIQTARAIELDYASSDDPKLLKGRIAELERQLRRSEAINDVLKKATAYFSSPNQPDSHG